MSTTEIIIGLILIAIVTVIINNKMKPPKNKPPKNNSYPLGDSGYSSTGITIHPN